MMSVTKELTKEIISKFAISENDTGSSEVQIALFTKHISNLTEHLKINKKRLSSKKRVIIICC